MVEQDPVVDNETAMQLNRRLDGFRLAARRLLLARGAGILVSLFLATITFVVLLDWFMCFDAWFRVLLLLGIIMLIMVLWVRTVLPALRFHPSRTDIALRIERNHEFAEGRIASASQFMGTRDESHPMAGASIADAESVIETISTNDIFRPRGTIGWVVCGLLLVILSITAAIWIPGPAATGVTRILLPLSSASWPARTAVTSLMDSSSGNTVHGRGTALLMRAANETPGFPGGPVWIEFRVHENGSPTDWNSLLLTHQGAGIHERVLDPDGERIEFRFMTDDASTTTQEILIVDLPEIADAHLHITPPQYAVDTHQPRDIPLLDGGVLRGRIGESLLRGSELVVDITSNNPLVIPDEAPEQWLSDILITTHEPTPSLHADPDDPRRFQLKWVLDEPVRQVVQLRDANGLQSLDPWNLYIESTTDQEPTVAFEHPSQDLSLLPGARLEPRLTASDDFQLDQMRIHVAPDITGDEDATSTRHSLDTTLDLTNEDPSTNRSMTVTLDLAEWDLEPGTTLLMEGMVRDSHRDAAGLDRVTNAAPRRIQIIDESSFLSMIRNRFKLLQQRVKELDDRQDQLQRIVRSGGWTSGDQRDQSSLSRSLRDQREQLDSIRDEMNMNQSEDQQVEALLSFSTESLDRAAEASDSAVESMQAGPSDRAGALQNQEEVRFELGELVSMLGEDEESWLVYRQVERLIEQQRELLERFLAT